MISEVHVFEAGSCQQKEAFSLRGGRWRDQRFPALCALFRHPDEGWVLYDTGYDPGILRSGAGFATRVYSRLMKVVANESTSVERKLQDLGLEAADVSTVVLSHFHPDHIGGARLFPNAKFLCSRDGYESVCRRPRRLGFQDFLLPEAFGSKCRFVEDLSSSKISELGRSGFGCVYDLFGDGAVELVLIDGHAPKQVGLLVRGEERRCFLVSDAAWSRRAIRENRPPSGLTRFIHDDWGALGISLARLHALSKIHPDWSFVPSHCEEALEEGCVSL